MLSNLSLTQLGGRPESKLHLVADFIPWDLMFIWFGLIALLLNFLLCLHLDLVYRVIDLLDVLITKTEAKHHRWTVSRQFARNAVLAFAALPAA
jgi:hypothetical protein